MMYVILAIVVALLLGNIALVWGRSRKQEEPEQQAADTGATLDLDPYLDSFASRSLKLGGKVYQVRDPEQHQGLRLALELQRVGRLLTSDGEKDPDEIERRLHELRSHFASYTGIPARVVMKLPLPALLDAISFISGSPAQAETGGQAPRLEVSR